MHEITEDHPDWYAIATRTTRSGAIHYLSHLHFARDGGYTSIHQYIDSKIDSGWVSGLDKMCNMNRIDGEIYGIKGWFGDAGRTIDPELTDYARQHITYIRMSET